MNGDDEAVQHQIRRRVVISASGCWEWQGCRQSNGYGRVRLNGRTEYVHRAAFMAFKGPFHSDKDVCHSCDNRRCCNPAHLFLGTRQDNMRDAKAKGRLSQGEKHAEHICGEKGPGAKLKLQQVIAIRRSAKDGAKLSDLADIAMVSIDNIRCIVRGDTWKDEEKCAA